MLVTHNFTSSTIFLNLINKLYQPNTMLTYKALKKCIKLQKYHRKDIRFVLRYRESNNLLAYLLFIQRGTVLYVHIEGKSYLYEPRSWSYHLEHMLIVEVFFDINNDDSSEVMSLKDFVGAQYG